MTQTPVYSLDIETDTSVSPTSGLDPYECGVTSVAVSSEEETKILDLESLTEKELLEALEKYLASLAPGIISSWNGSVFDFPFLAKRYELLGVKTSLELRYDPSIFVKYEPTPGFDGGVRVRWGKHKHLDVQFAFRSLAEKLGIRWSLKPVGRSLGFNPVEVDRTKIHLLSVQEEREYVASDSILTRALGIKALSEELPGAEIDAF